MTVPAPEHKANRNSAILSFILIGVVIALIVVAAMWGNTPSGRAWINAHQNSATIPPTALTTPTLHKVEYIIKATECAGFKAVFSLPGGTKQMDVPCMPEMSSLGGVSVNPFDGTSGEILTFTLVNTTGNGRATFSCTIRVDGKDLATIQAHGIGNTASCSTVVP